ncbi:homoserine kinase [Aerococcaceae bacterium DSM 111020]|nr:homoserine kinase [Aerococcaceae bacterium DSM 111020]
MIFTIQIPATSANLGLGFDSMGIALEKFLTIEAEESSEWMVEFLDSELEVLPTDETNIVFRAAEYLAQAYEQTMPKLSIKMASEIPLTHGLGSSSSAIVAGIELANHYLQLGLSQHEKIYYATELEGHPDNVGPCITGAGFVGYYSSNDGLYYETFDLPGMGVILSIPDYEINTEQARRALPDHYSRQQAVQQNAMNNVMVLKALKREYHEMGQLMMKDNFHEPYRQSMIHEFQEVKFQANANGAYATVISGAGPTILTFAPEDQIANIISELIKTVPDCTHESVKILNK